MARDDRRKKGRMPLRTSVALVGDGLTEQIYFMDMRDTDRPANLSIFPDFPRRVGSYRGVLDQAMGLVRDYTMVFALIDMDKVHQDGSLNNYQRDKARAERNGVRVLEQNPCFELWFLLHFVHTGRLFSNCDEVLPELRRQGRLPGYDKSERFQQAAHLYRNLRERLVANAIPNAILLEDQQQGQDRLFPRAQVYKFFQWYLERL